MCVLTLSLSCSVNASGVDPLPPIDCSCLLWQCSCEGTKFDSIFGESQIIVDNDYTWVDLPERGSGERVDYNGRGGGKHVKPGHS